MRPAFLQRKVTIFEWEFDILVVILVFAGLVIGLYLSLTNVLTQLFAGTSTTITKDTDSHFNQGTLASTEISGSGTSALIQLQGGAGDWADANWQYRRPLTITSTNLTTLTEYQVMVTLTTGNFDYTNVESDCDDIRFGDTGGSFINHFQISCDTSGTSEFWVQIPSVAANDDTTIYVYYGNGGATNGSDEAATFTYSSEKVVGYALHDTVNRLNVKSLEDGNSITHNGSTLNLNEDDTGAFTSVDVDGAISATKLFGATDPDDNTDAIVPVSFAGIEILATSRDSGSGTEEFFLLSPWGTANVTIYADGSSCYTNSSVGSTVVSTGGSCSDSDGTTYRITSDIPILAFMTENTTDPYPLHPSDIGPWYGTEGTRWSVSAEENGASVDYDKSGNSGTSSTSIAADRDFTENTSNGYGAGNAMKVMSQDNPITANQWADGNGGDAAIFLPYYELGTKFGGATTIDYIAVASPTAATCTTYDNTGSQVDQVTASGINGNVYKADFGTGNSNTYISTGWKMICDGPVHAYYEKSADSENNVWTYAQMRQYSHPHPSVGNPESEQGSLAPSGTWESPTNSNVIDLVWNNGWGGDAAGSTAFSATVADVSANATIAFQMRVAQTKAGLSGASYKLLGTANSGTTFTKTNTELDALGLSTDDYRYVQVKATLTSSDGLSNPKFDSFTITYLPDETAPTHTANIAMQKIQGGDAVAQDEWTNNLAPYFSWDPASDNEAGIKGYCLYLGTDQNGNPATSKGLLGTSPVSTSGTTCQFITSGTEVDFATISLRGSTWLTTSASKYYLNIKAIDQANNIIATSEAFSFKFDNTPPENPTGLSAPQGFLRELGSFTIAWPTNGDSIATDDYSGVKGYQYKIGSSGTWYGSNHTGDEDCDDLITSGSYTLDSDYDSLTTGENTFYFRTWDETCNVSSTNLTAILKYNADAPSNPTNLVVTPDYNTENAFSFEWEQPDTFQGNASNLSYCYSINAQPTANNCIETSETSLEENAFATQPGENTFYVVAKDEASNVNYDDFTSVDFTADTPAPGVARNLDVADISTKTTENWKLAISWDPPENEGAGISSYRVYQGTEDVSCASSSSDFTQIATTSGTSYVDGELDQVDHYYCVKACDSANNCSAYSNTATGFPDGKFTEPADLIAQPEATGVTTRKATIAWTTNRTSDSKVAYGLVSDDYFEEEPSNSEHVTDHSISLNNLDPGTTYYYVAKWTDEDGNTGISDEKSFTTAPAPTVKSVSIPTIGLSNAVIKYTTTNASNVKIYYGPTTAFGGALEVVTSPVESTYTSIIENLNDGTTYNFKINTIDSDGFEYEGTILDFTTVARPRISNVRIQQVTGTAQPSVLISWESNTEISSIVTYYPEDNPSATIDEVDVERTRGEHQMLISGLLPETTYSLVVRGQDQLGNEATSDTQSLTTSTDTRPPVISNLEIDTSIVNADGSNQTTAQITVSWDTDEPTTSQIEFGEGTGTTYAQRTQEDTNLTFNHLVVISGLSPSKVYHLHAVSTDSAGNTGSSIDNVTITPKATDNALDLVIRNLQQIFGFLVQ